MSKLNLLYYFLLVSLFSFSQKTVLDGFLDNSYGWNLTTDRESDHLGFISDGHLNLERLKTQGSSIYVNQNLKVNVDKPFQVNTLIESRFRGWGYQGLVLSDVKTGEYLLFATDSFGIARGIYHTEYEDLEIFIAEANVKGTSINNQLEISRVGQQLIFSQNDNVLNTVEVPYGFEGEYSVGFYMSQKQSAKVDYLKIEYQEEKELESKAHWSYPISYVSSTEKPDTTLSFAISEVYMYQSVTLKINQEKINLFEIAKEVSKAKYYEFEIKASLNKDINTIELEYLDHNGLVFKERKLMFRKKDVYSSINHALLFATDDYNYWTDLANPVKDMDSLASILSNLYGFEVKVIKNASRDSIMNQIKSASETYFEENEQLLVFFSGHGTYDGKNNESYFVCPESRTGKISPHDYVSLKYVERMLDQSLCNNICLMTDICFGGETGSSLQGQSGKETNKSRYFIASGKSIVSDGRGLNGNSPFVLELYDFLVNRKAKNSIDLNTWVRKVQSNNKDLVFRRFGSYDLANSGINNFQFILK